MAFNDLPSSPLDPKFNSLRPNEQNPDVGMNDRSHQAPGFSSGADHIHRLRCMPVLASELNLADIPIREAPSIAEPLTPVSRWLQTVEPVTPRSDLAFRSSSSWSSDSDISTDSESVYSNNADQDERSPVRTFQAFDFNRRGLQTPEGISPTNPGYPVADVQPMDGPSINRLTPESPTKKISKTNPIGKPKCQGKKKNCASGNLPCRVAVVIPMTKLRSGKQPPRKPLTPIQCPVLAPTRDLPRPCEQPIFLCPMCGLRLPLISAMIQHYKQAHPNRLAATPESQKGRSPPPL